MQRSFYLKFFYSFNALVEVGDKLLFSGGPRDDRQVVVSPAAASESRQPSPGRSGRGREVEREETAGQSLGHVLLRARPGGVADLFDASSSVVPSSHAENVGGFSSGELIAMCSLFRRLLIEPLQSFTMISALFLLA